MATIEILEWKENFTGFTIRDVHARSELKKRLRRGLKASPADIRRLAHQISERELLVLPQVYDESVYSLTQILETTGARIHVSLADTQPRRLLKKCPDR